MPISGLLFDTRVSNVVRCALPGGTSLVKQDQNGVSYTFKGSLGDRFTLDIPGGINGEIVSVVPDAPDFKSKRRGFLSTPKIRTECNTRTVVDART